MIAKKTRTLKIIISLFWLFMLSYYIFYHDLEAILLWCALPPLFGCLFYITSRFKFSVLTLFMGVFCICNSILPSFFFLTRDRYTHTGWTAVKDFDFSLGQFFNVYLQVFVMGFFILISALVLCYCFLKKKSNHISKMQNENASFITQRLLSYKANNLWYSFLLVILIITVAFLNNWMYQHGMALTGLPSPRLPYKLTGALYYFTRYVFPVCLFVVYKKTNRSWILGLLLISYAIFVGISQCSREPFILIVLPVLFFAFIERSYFKLTIYSIIVGILYDCIVEARGYVYVVASVGRAYADLSLSLPELIKTVFLKHGLINPVEGFMSILNRIDGTQQVILGRQFNPDVVGGSLKLFANRFLMFNNIDNNLYHLEWMGQTLPSGFWAGGGLTSTLLMIANNNYFILLGLCFVIACYILLGEIFVRYVIRVTGDNLVGTFSVVFYVSIFYTMFGSPRFYVLFFISIFFLFLRSISPRLSMHNCNKFFGKIKA